MTGLNRLLLKWSVGKIFLAAYCIAFSVDAGSATEPFAVYDAVELQIALQKLNVQSDLHLYSRYGLVVRQRPLYRRSSG